MAQRTIFLSESHKLADEIGEFVFYWGFKKVHGRIWTHLILSSRPLDASDLIKRLGISKALASMSLSQLLRFQIIEEMGKSARGTQLYVANPEVLSLVLSILKMREAERLARLRKAARTLKSLPSKKHKRHELNSQNVHALNRLFDVAHVALNSFMKNFRFDMSAAKKCVLSSPTHAVLRN